MAPSDDSPNQRIDLESMYDAVLDPVLTIDTRGIVLSANPAAERVFGFSQAEMIGNNVSQLMGEPYRSEHNAYVAAYLKTGEARAIGQIRKVIGRHRSGREFSCELSVGEIRLADDERRFVGVVRDITEREDMAARLAHAERLAAVGELAAGVAHEVNNPVNTIINCAQLIKDGDDDPELCDHIMAEGIRIAAIVRDLLDFSRDRREQHSATRMDEVTRRTLSLISGRLEKQGIAFHTEITDGLPWIRGRSQNLQQVLLNLLLNARDAVLASNEATPTISVNAQQHIDDDQEEWILLTVRDNGVGIAPEFRERIFQPFFTTKRDSGGTGLGLAVSHGIIGDHNGKLSVTSKVAGEDGTGGWTEFAVQLPVWNDTDSDDGDGEDADADADTSDRKTKE